MKPILALVATALLVGPAWVRPAEPPADEARTRYQRGEEAYRQGRYRDAIAEFQAAYRLRPSPALHYNIGQARERLGEPAEALASYAEYLRLEPQAPNRKGVERSMETLRSRVAPRGKQVLLVLTDPWEAEVALDGQPRGKTPFAAAMAPGAHRVAVSLPGHQPVTRDVTVARDRGLELHLALTPLPKEPPPALAATPPPPPPEATRPVPAPQPPEQRSWVGPIVAAGVAVVAASAAVTLGVSARNAQDDLLGGLHSQSEADALASKARGSATAANVLYGVAGAAAITGGLLVFVF